jgi:GDP-4-dehydro-6-deoxy-D-mannose reductase
MKILVTGAEGFVGRHMVSELLAHKHEVLATAIESGSLETLHGRVALNRLDVTDQSACIELVQRFNPDATIHLAGLAHTKETEKNLPLLFNVNVASVSNIADALRSTPTTGPRALLFASSAFVYGAYLKTGTLQCNENTPLAPRGSYGYSKLAAESVARLYESPELQVYIVRPFNHIGPGQHPSFVVAGFAQRILSAKDGSTIETGNLNSKRDFTDVRDIVRGYRLIVEKRPAARTFVLGSGNSYPIQTVFDELCRLANKRLTTTVRADLMRSGDEADITADAKLAGDVLGWVPEIPLSKSLTDALLASS